MVRVIAFIVILVIIIAALVTQTSTQTSTPQSGFPITTPGGSVNVTEIYVASPDDACGLNGTTHAGFNGTPTGGWTLTFLLPAAGSVPCTVQGVSSPTGGFTAFSYYLPMNVTSPGTPLEVNVFLPDGSYTGPLDLTFN